jgi:YfiR/HmsC-like
MKKQAVRSLWALHRKRFCREVVAVSLLLAGQTQTRGQDRTPVEYQVKAAFLLNFAKFIQWPPNAFQDDRTPMAVCVFRYDPFGSVLDEIMRGKNINNRELLARRISDFPELNTCQVVFVSEREGKLLPEVLNSLKGSSALVIGEAGDFAERGGGIQFFLEDNRLRFAVNVDALQRARLTASSKLLALARIVHDQDYPKGS